MNETNDEQTQVEPTGSYLSRVTKYQWGVVGLALVMVAAMLAYYWIEFKGLKTTAMMFVGLPALLAIMFTLLPRPKSTIWLAMKGTTIALCLSAIVLGEGIPCVIMAAPLFYLAAFIVAKAYDRGRESANKNVVRALVFLPLAILSLEGTHDSLTFSRTNHAHVEKNIAVSASAFEERLSRPFAFQASMPLYLRVFPEPTGMRGSGLKLGDERTVSFRGPGAHGGSLVLRVTEREPNRVKFKIVSDTTKIASWMKWRTAAVQWRERNGALSVRWTFAYDRKLDPAWYFGPLQRYAVELGGSYLTDNLAE